MKRTQSHRWEWIGLLCLLGFLCGSSRTEAAPTATREVLSNGLIFLHVAQHELPLVTVSLTLPAGTMSETVKQAGLAALTADLVQEGTTTHQGETLAQAVAALGGQIGFKADRETATGQATVLRSDLEAGLKLLAEMTLHPTFAPNELTRKVNEMVGQIARRMQNPAIQVRDRFREMLYGDHPYGRRIIGRMETLRTLTRHDVTRFHRDYYKPEGAIVVVVGDVRQDEAKRALLAAFEGWTGVPQPWPNHPDIRAPTDLERVRIDRDVEQAHILFGHTGVPRQHPDYDALQVMNYILGGGGFESRLLTRIREEQGLAYSAWSAFASGRIGGTFMAGLGTQNSTANQALHLLFEALNDIQQHPVSEQELADAKAFMSGSFPLDMTSNRKLAAIFTEIERFNLGLDYVTRFSDLVQAVTRQDIQRVARRYLHPSQGVLVVLADMAQAKLQD